MCTKKGEVASVLQKFDNWLQLESEISGNVFAHFPDLKLWESLKHFSLSPFVKLELSHWEIFASLPQ